VVNGGEGMSWHNPGIYLLIGEIAKDEILSFAGVIVDGLDEGDAVDGAGEGHKFCKPRLFLLYELRRDGGTQTRI
jgi:hypothetical protein